MMYQQSTVCAEMYMFLTLTGKQEKTMNFKITFQAMKKPGNSAILGVNFHEKQCNNLEKSNICLKKRKEKKGEAQ